MSATIYPARKVITMNPARPRATHVAVRDGRILGAGSLAELAGWGDYRLDDRFADKVLMPGLVEGHSHAHGGLELAAMSIAAIFDRTDPDGTVWPGLQIASRRSSSGSQRSGSRVAGPGEAPVSGWALDPIYYGETAPERAHDMDRVSATRPVGVLPRQRPHYEREHEGAGTGRAAARRASTIRACRSARTGCRRAR